MLHPEGHKCTGRQNLPVNNNSGLTPQDPMQTHPCFVGSVVVLALFLLYKFLIAFSVGEPTADYWVLATDYENFSIVYSCYKILTRTQGL